jgi:hypothetical protein
MALTKTQLIGGGFQDLEGNPLALGFLTMELSQDEVATGVGQVGFGIKIRVPLDGSGNVSGTVLVWGNDDLTPVNSYYTVNAFTAKGQLAWGPQYQVVVSGATFDLGTWIPNSLSIVNSGGGSGVTSLNTETGAINIIAGTNVTVASAGQNITISSGTVAPLIVETNGVANSSQLTLNLVAGANVTLTNTSGGNVTIASPTSSTIPAGRNVTLGWRIINLGNIATSGFQNITIFNKIYGRNLINNPVANNWKMRMAIADNHNSFPLVLGNMVLLTTLANSLAVISSTPITIGGLGAQTLALNSGETPTFIESDPINLALDTLHDYTAAFYIANVAGNSNLLFAQASAGANAGFGMIGLTTSGDQTAISTLPADNTFTDLEWLYQVVTV